MKKIILLTFLFLSVFTLFSQEPVITDIKSDSNVTGSKFFPLYVGAKWNWEIKSNGSITVMQWQIISKCRITDKKNNLTDMEAFKIKTAFIANDKEIPELGGFTYIFVSQGFIVNYDKKENGYEIEKMIPLDPKTGDEWAYSGTKYKITEISSNSVKIESSNETDDKYGYQLFIKDVGPYEVYEYSSKNKEEMFMTLLNSSNTPAASAKKEVPAVVKKNDAQQIDNKDLYTKTLSKDKKYLQIGAFNIPYYAEDLAGKLNKSGFKAKIFLDKDGFYKIMIETDNPDKTKKDVKDKTGLDSFLRK